ncbi:MAG: hypothetical protein O2783_07340 [Chloroflexi bacterium]|nr:hypothetical protein [Chloroflexota bacterium]
MPDLEDLVKKTQAAYLEAVDDEQDVLEEYFSRSREGLPMRVLDDDEAKAIDEASQRVQMKHLAFVDAFLALNDSQGT